MTRATRSTAELGEVLAALYDEAASYSGDPRVVTKLATHALADLLVRAPSLPALRPHAWAPAERGGRFD